VVLTHEIERLTRCRDCGTKPEEWDPKKGGDIHAYYGETWTCEGCKAKEDVMDAAVKNAGKGGSVAGVKTKLVTKEEREKAVVERNKTRPRPKPTPKPDKV
jgi:hypothetical protein